MSCGHFAQPRASSGGLLSSGVLGLTGLPPRGIVPQSANSSRREINCAQSTLLPSVSEPATEDEKLPGLDPGAVQEGLDDVPPLSPLQPISGEEAVQVTAGSLPPSSVTLRDYVDHSETSEEVSASRSGFIQDRKTSRCSQPPPATGF